MKSFLTRFLNIKIELAKDTAKECVMLHNFVHEIDAHNFDHTVFVKGLSSIPAAVVIILQVILLGDFC